MKARREELGGFLPGRKSDVPEFRMPEESLFEEFFKGSGKRKVATTMAAVQMLSKLLKDKEIGKLIVPIVPDESRTFGMDSLFRQSGIYSHKGQLYEPVDKESLLYYKEAKDGAILGERITEASSMSSFIAAGTAYSTHQINAIPFYIFYSMFGFQRTGDLIWAAADARARGFLLGGTAGRTTLAGEGLQHQDGHSHLLAMSLPSVEAYDPAYSYELAVIIKEGLKRMYSDGNDIFYYITVMNEKYEMPEMPSKKSLEEHILKGMYKLKSGRNNELNINLLGSGSILNEVIRASEILKNDYNIVTDIWSVTSYKKLYDNAIEIQRQNRLNNQKKKNFIQEQVGSEKGLFIAASDFVKALPLSVSKWFPGEVVALGTDGFGKSDHRDELRDHFEVDSRHIVWSTLETLKNNGKINDNTLKEAKKKLRIDADKTSPQAI
jgi:pyruvate dehydrogenase E1 component